VSEDRIKHLGASIADAETFDAGQVPVAPVSHVADSG
jgi:hypothetical protein